MEFPWIRLVNLVFCIIILILGLRQYRKTGVKAYIFVGLGFVMYAISHILYMIPSGTEGMVMAKLPGIYEALIGVRSIGYILVIIGMAV